MQCTDGEGERNDRRDHGDGKPSDAEGVQPAEGGATLRYRVLVRY